MGYPMPPGLARLEADAYAGPWGKGQSPYPQTLWGSAVSALLADPACPKGRERGQRRVEHEMPNQEMRERTFDVCAANLPLCFLEVKDTFLCPFCLRAFTKEAVPGERPRVILAHCVPEALK